MWVYCLRTLTERKCRVEKSRDKGNNKNQVLEIVFKSIQTRIWAFTFVLSDDNLAQNSQ